MYAVRHWSVRNAGRLAWLYDKFSSLLLRLHPLFDRIGYARLEAPMAAVERWAKGLLFDCRMCGHCTLLSSGMSCPMNCPKTLRNGPCGGVRPDGGCEIIPTMRCVWVEAWSGARRMRDGMVITVVQEPLDQRLSGISSWLRVTREDSMAADRDGEGAG